MAVDATETHRVDQAKISAAMVAEAFTAWELLNPDDLDRSTGRWLVVMLAAITAHRSRSIERAALYLEVIRRLEVGPGAPPFLPILAPGIDRKATTTSLLVTGPITVKRAMAGGRPLGTALDLGLARVARSASRHVLNGGRETILATVAKDPRARGYVRKTSGAACDYCRDLAGGGKVYRTEKGGTFPNHDGCHCAAKPVYR